ncbi:hypothetical protein DFH27DRAFT_521164 [Peziza echinospora]|nr:hypothetical protein DFH27DRAFT_521164 [Peziza echinospora]
MSSRAIAMSGGISTAVDVVDQSGKIITTTKTVFSAFKDAKAAYHARKAEIVNQRQLEREARSLERAQREGAKLAALEKEARRTERQKKRLEHDKKKLIEGPVSPSPQSGVKAIEWKEAKVDKSKETEKEREKRKKEKREKEKKLLTALVVLDPSKRDKGDKDKDKKKHKSHGSSSKDKDGKDKKDGKDSKDKAKKKHHSGDESGTVALIPPSGLPTPPLDDDLSSDDGAAVATRDLAARRLSHNPTALVLAPVILNNVPGGAQAQQLLDMSQSFLNMFDPDGDSPLTALLLQLTNILDTFDCLNASITTLVASLSRDPDALAMVGLTLAEIAAVVAKTAPGVIVAAKAAFPIIFALLASPQFLVTAGASVIILGGYQIVRRVTGYGQPTAPPTPKIEAPPKQLELEDHLAFGPGMDDHSDTEVSAAPAPTRPAPMPIQAKRIEAPAKQKALPPLPEDAVAATPPKSPKRTHTSPAIAGASHQGSSSARSASPITSIKEEKEKVEKPKLQRESSSREGSSSSKRKGMKGFLFRQQTIGTRHDKLWEIEISLAFPFRSALEKFEICTHVLFDLPTYAWWIKAT